MTGSGSIQEVRTQGADVEVGAELAEILQFHPVDKPVSAGYLSFNLRRIKFGFGTLCVVVCVGEANAPELPVVLHAKAHLTIFSTHSVPQRWSLSFVSDQKWVRKTRKPLNPPFSGVCQWEICMFLIIFRSSSYLEERRNPVRHFISLLACTSATFPTTEKCSKSWMFACVVCRVNTAMVGSWMSFVFCGGTCSRNAPPTGLAFSSLEEKAL